MIHVYYKYQKLYNVCKNLCLAFGLLSSEGWDLFMNTESISLENLGKYDCLMMYSNTTKGPVTSVGGLIFLSSLFKHPKCTSNELAKVAAISSLSDFNISWNSSSERNQINVF